MSEKSERIKQENSDTNLFNLVNSSLDITPTVKELKQFQEEALDLKALFQVESELKTGIPKIMIKILFSLKNIFELLEDDDKISDDLHKFFNYFIVPKNKIGDE